MKCKKFNISLFSKYRGEIMGIATILIILCHASVFGVSMHPGVKYVVQLGNLGVEIFLLMSGLGMAHSLRIMSSATTWSNESINYGGGNWLV